MDSVNELHLIECRDMRAGEVAKAEAALRKLYIRVRRLTRKIQKWDYRKRFAQEQLEKSDKLLEEIRCPLVVFKFVDNDIGYRVLARDHGGRRLRIKCPGHGPIWYPEDDVDLEATFGN